MYCVGQTLTIQIILTLFKLKCITHAADDGAEATTLPP